jgi:CheY-like chemotaxis protein
MSRNILLADNNELQRTSLAAHLRYADFKVFEAENITTARNLLQTVEIDLAVVDLRLDKDSNRHDVTGIMLAKEAAFSQIPKIIISAFQLKAKDIRSTLGPVVDGLPAAVYFVGKEEGPQALIQAINETISLWPRFKLPLKRVSQLIESDHEEARHQSRLNFWAAFFLSILGCLVMFVGVVLAWSGHLTIGLVGTGGGILVEVLGVLFSKRVDTANRRMDVYHKELLQAYWLENIISTCEQLPVERRFSLIEQAVGSATETMFGQTPRSTGLST